MNGRPRSLTALRHLVRAGAVAGLGAAIAVPLLRRRWRLPAGVTVAAAASGPLAVAILHPRSRKRDVVLFAMQMWAFTVAHELPYDDPQRLRERLRIRYPIEIDRAIGRGALPGARLQRALAGKPGVRVLDQVLSWAHWAWFIEPYVALLLILLRDHDRFPRAARRMAAVFDTGCAVYFAIPTAPPWWSAQQGHTGGETMRRIMFEVGEPTWGRAWERMYNAFGGNPWAAMPSLHFATSVQAARSLSETGRVEGTIGWSYAVTLGFALVYLGEHYVTDLIAGALLVAAVNRAEALAEPLVSSINGGLQRLERIASG